MDVPHRLPLVLSLLLAACTASPRNLSTAAPPPTGPAAADAGGASFSEFALHLDDDAHR